MSSGLLTQALHELEYPAKLQRLLLTPEREVHCCHLTLCARHPMRILGLMQHEPYRTSSFTTAAHPGPATACCSAASAPPGGDGAAAQVLVELVITRDNGEIETFNAFRVQHDNSRGPYKGGLRRES